MAGNKRTGQSKAKRPKPHEFEAVPDFHEAMQKLVKTPVIERARPKKKGQEAEVIPGPHGLDT